MRISSVLLALTIFSALLANPAAAYTITLNGYDTSFQETRANDFSTGGSVFEILNPATLPYSDSSSSVDAGSSAESDYDHSTSAFTVTLDHIRANTANSYGYSQGQIFFSVDEAVEYTATGSYLGKLPLA